MRTSELLSHVRAGLRAAKLPCELPDAHIRMVLEECLNALPRGASSRRITDCAIEKVTDICAEMAHEHHQPRRRR